MFNDKIPHFSIDSLHSFNFNALTVQCEVGERPGFTGYCPDMFIWQIENNLWQVLPDPLRAVAGRNTWHITVILRGQYPLDESVFPLGTD